MRTGGRADYVVIPSPASPMDALVAAARAEGQLNVIGLPRGWNGYGAIIDSFKARYGLTVNELLPNASSSCVIVAIRNSQGKDGAHAPDVIDVGVSFAASATKERLLQPHKVSTWSTIPDHAKNADGYWCGGYYGTIVFEINTDYVAKIPIDWLDLAGPEYRDAIGLAGNLASDQAIQSIFAAGLSAASGNIDQAASRGLRFFADLNRRGNFVACVGD